MLLLNIESKVEDKTITNEVYKFVNICKMTFYGTVE